MILFLVQLPIVCLGNKRTQYFMKNEIYMFLPVIIVLILLLEV